VNEDLSAVVPGSACHRLLTCFASRLTVGVGVGALETERAVRNLTDQDGLCVIEVLGMTQEEILEAVVRFMVSNSSNGVYHGTPRELMEELGVSSGPLYDGLRRMGITRVGRGQNADWTIPDDIIRRYRQS
jgi:hypothetical protein